MAETKRKIPVCPLSMSCSTGHHICLQEECAWWVSNTRSCVAYVIAHNNILDIKQKQGKQ